MTSYEPVRIIITVRNDHGISSSSDYPIATVFQTQAQLDAAPGSAWAAKVRDACQHRTIREALIYANGYNSGRMAAGAKSLPIVVDSILQAPEFMTFADVNLMRHR